MLPNSLCLVDIVIIMYDQVSSLKRLSICFYKSSDKGFPLIYIIFRAYLF